MNHHPKIFCAIDTPDLAHARDLARAMAQIGCGIKLGLEFFCSHGPRGVEDIRNANPDLPLFLDLKLHDIPNTVAGAVKSVMGLRPTYLTLHAGGGIEMMKAANDAADGRIRLLPVTVLTSLDDKALHDVGQATPSETQVLRLARLVKNTGLPGVVCSGLDIAPIRHALGNDFILMVPGIRPASSDAGDQKRVMTPAKALRQGATHLVIGRPITGAPDPQEAAQAILEDLLAG